MIFTLGKVAGHISAELYGDPECEVSDIAALQSAKSGQISFLSNRKYYRYLKHTKASAVIIKREDLGRHVQYLHCLLTILIWVLQVSLSYFILIQRLFRAYTLQQT